MQRVWSGLVVVWVATAACAAAGAQCPPNCPEKRAISATGNGQVTVDADLAIVRVGYKLFAEDAKTAYANAVETSNVIMTALTGSGIAKSDIESTSQVLQHTAPYEVQPYPMSEQERHSREFSVTQSWVIRVKPDIAAKALDTAVTAGANESGWIQWVVNNPGPLQARAAALAVADARLAAEQMAQKSGVRLGRLMTASLNPGPYFYSGNRGGGSGLGAGTGFAMGAVEAVTVGNQQLAVNSRRVVFEVTVMAEFAIE